ncbi:MAG: hypothetical protein ACRC7V_07635 [Lachnospiraceae bacterium]
MGLIKWIVYALLLSIVTLQDIKERKVSLIIMIQLFIVGMCFLIYSILKEETNFIEFILYLVPGIFLILFSKISKNKLGIADGILCFIVILFFPNVIGIYSIVFGFLIGSFVSLFLVLVKKRKKEEVFPFFPCIFISSNFMIILDLLFCNVISGHYL